MPFLVHAQDDAPAWEVILLHSDGGEYELVTVTAEDNVEQSPLPDGFALGQAGARISPDGRYLVSNENDTPYLLVADLEAGTCCQRIPFNDTPMNVVTLGGFNPEGTQIAVSYLLDKPELDLFVTRLMAIDLESGETVSDLETTPGTIEGGVLPYQQLLDWREDGVYFYESCIMCVEEAADQTLQVWEPEANEIRFSEETWDSYGDTLPLTGEHIGAANNQTYPLIDAPEEARSHWSYRNVVVLAGERAQDGRAVVYYDFANSDLYSVRWVADGNAFLIFPQPGKGATTLVVPGVSPQPQVFWIQEFLTGTPDGWLMRDDNMLYHFSVENGSVTQAVLGEFPGGLRVVQSAPLGESADAEFLSVLPPESVTCPGFLPSQLTVGGEGFVTPGAANNVREYPTTNSEIVAKIAGGERFDVAAGPICVNGVAWWRVQYLDFTGWTAEGEGEVYWLVPVVE